MKIDIKSSKANAKITVFDFSMHFGFFADKRTGYTNLDFLKSVLCSGNRQSMTDILSQTKPVQLKMKEISLRALMQASL